MKHLLSIIILLISFIHIDAQTIRFNKSYLPDSSSYTNILNCFYDNNEYKLIGLNYQLYPKGISAFSLDSSGNLQENKIFGKNGYSYYLGYSNGICKDYNFYYLGASQINYNVSPVEIYSVFYKFSDNFDTLFTNRLYTDTMTCEILNNTLMGGYLYSIGVKAYGVDDADHYDVILLKSDTLGNLIWLKNYGSISMDIGYKITSTYDNNIIIATMRCGYYTPNNFYYNNDCQWWILKLDTAGNVIWDKNFGHPDIRDSRPFGLIETSDSCYIITGSLGFEMNGSSEMLRGRILKIDKFGNIVWDRLYGHKTPETYTSIIKEKSNNDLLVIHNEGWYSIENQIIYNPLIECLTAKGKIKWFRKYHFWNNPHAEGSVFNSFDFTNDGGYIFAGYGKDYDSIPAQRSWVIKTDSLGFDGVTDFVSDTTYRMEYVRDTCYSDTVIVYVSMYGITAPYTITYSSFDTHDSLFYSPMYDSFVADSLIITPSELSGNDSVINIICQITDGLGRILTDTISVNVACLVNVNEEISEENFIKIYPNPTTNTLFVEMTPKSPKGDLKNKNLQIIDINGKVVLSTSLRGGTTKPACPVGRQSVDISDLPNGVYFVKIGEQAEKFVKE